MSTAALLTILGMAMATYATRVAGFLLPRNRRLGSRARAVLDAAPGCVLIAVIAPYFVSPHPAELLALAITVLAAWRLPMLPAVFAGVVSLAVLQHLLGV